MIDERSELEMESRAAKPMIKSGVMYAIVAVVCFGAGMYTAGGAGGSILQKVPLIGGNFLDATPAADADLTDFWRAWNTLDARFVQTHGSSTPPTSEEKVWGAIQGLASSFGDPYTVYMPPAEAKIFGETIAGNFSGVGMEIAISEGVLTVIAPLKGTPAEKSGIRAGDKIITIDETSTDGLSTDAAVTLIRGEKGTTVTFTIFRDGEILTIPVVRDTIQVPQIEQGLDAASGVYSIALYEFSGTSSALFADALAQFRASGSSKLIVDLRGNPGGYLEAAVNIGSHFLPKGTIIVTEDYKGKQENAEHRSLGTGGVTPGTEIVVLLDKGSASASEILAGALKDNGVATIIGTSSFGKGSVQELVDIDGGYLKVTVARWLTPGGNNISDGGIAPDIEVTFTEEDIAAERDVQKERAIQFLVTGK